jgi:glycosyltransferase involved in cell wall biosynthesis
MLKVLHIGKFYPPAAGGMERVVRSLCTSASGRLDSHVLAFNAAASTYAETVEGVPVTRVGTWGKAGSVPVSPGFISHLRRIDADMVVLHEPNPWALLSYALAAPRTPLAIWYHSDVVRPRLQYQLFYAPLARRVYDRATSFIVSSPVLASHAVALRPYRDRTQVIPFGIEQPPPRDRELVNRAEAIRQRLAQPIVLFAGRLVAYKGVDVLINATADLPVTVVIVGDGPMRASWTALAERHTRPGRVVFTGEIPDGELNTYFEACDMFVLPSVTRAEAFGFVQLEAMAHGKPVVSTELPSGVPWVNRDGVTGFLVPPGSVAALNAAIRQLVSDAPLRHRLGAEARRRVRDEFSLRQMADRFVRVCHDVATSRVVRRSEFAG